MESCSFECTTRRDVSRLYQTASGSHIGESRVKMMTSLTQKIRAKPSPTRAPCKREPDQSNIVRNVEANLPDGRRSLENKHEHVWRFQFPREPDTVRINR